jgi:hypothetical protein
MKTKSLAITAGLVVVIVGAVILFYRKEHAPPRPDPSFYHTPEGVNHTIQEQRTVLADALQKKDLQFIHGQMYYLDGLADALSSTLEGEGKQRVDPKLAELKRIAEEIDNFSGRGNFEATQASLQKLFSAFAELDAEFKPAKK